MTRAISATADIAAPRAEVWAVLRDVARYPEWNPFTVSVDTSFALGTPVVMQVALRPPRTIRQVERISGYVEGESFSWGVVMGARWFLRADRVQRLEDLPDGGTRYWTSDVFEGVGVRLMTALVGRHVQRGFDDVARSLKARCEG